jgi:predicted kinase
VGLTCVGKSHYLRSHNIDAVVLSTDNIIESIAKRERITYDEFFNTMGAVAPNRFVAQVLPELNRQIDYATSNNLDVVVDMQNIDVRSRALTYDNPKFANYRRIAVVFDDDQLSAQNSRYLEAVKMACAERGIEQDKTIPEHVIERSFNGYQRPTSSEGFEEIIDVQSSNPIIRTALMRNNPSRQLYRNNPLHINPAMRRNVSDQRKALRDKYRAKHGNDWWKSDSIKAKFEAELKKTPEGSFTRDGVSLSEPAASDSRSRGKKRKEKVKPLTGKALERAMKATSERTKYLDFTEEVEIKIKKKLGPLIKGRQGISDMAITSDDAGDYMTMMLGSRDILLEISKPSARSLFHMQITDTSKGDKKGIKAVSQSVDKKATSTKLANEAVKLYKRFLEKYGDKKSSSVTSYSGDRISLNMLKGEGLKRLAQAIGTFFPIIKGNVKVMMTDEDGAHLLLGSSKYHLVFEVDPKNKNSINLDIQADNEDMIEFIGIKASASLESMKEMVYDVLNTAHDFDGGKLLKRGFANKTLKQIEGGSKKSSSPKSSSKSRSASRARAVKAEFKIAKSGKSYKWELVIGGDIATKSGYKTKESAKSAFLKAIAQHEKLIEDRGVDTFDLYCSVRDL